MKRFYVNIRYLIVFFVLSFLFAGTSLSRSLDEIYRDKDLYKDIDVSTDTNTKTKLNTKKVFNPKFNTHKNYKNEFLLMSSYNKNQSYIQSIFENLKLGNLDIKTAVQKTIQEVSSPFIRLKEKNDSKFKLINHNVLLDPSSEYINPSIDSKEFTLTVGEFPICDGSIVVHNYKSLDYPLIFGETRELDIDFIPSTSHFPDPLSTKNLIFNKVREKYNGTFSLEEKQPCLFVKEDKLIPAFKYELRIHRKAYWVISDGIGILDFKKNFFNIDGTATIYNGNRDAGLKSFTLYNLDGSGYLKSDHFVTTALNRAYAADNNFNFTPDTSEFFETSVFTNVQNHYLWFKSLGFNWYSNYKMTLIPDAIISGDINNAYFMPESGSTAPSIQVGRGDGTIFKDLMIDKDVVSHEFGHFVIYSKLKNAEEDSQSLVLHEGLADFFVMIKNASPCFAPSICTQYSPICSQGCLRTATNNMLATDSNPQAHIKSQFLSGMLWDLKTKDGIPDEDLINLVFKSIFLLGENSGYKDFIASLLLADLANYNLKYCGSILERAKTRGLGSYISDLKCDAKTLSSVYIPSDTNVQPSSSSSSSHHSFCGSIKEFSKVDNKNNFKNNMFNFMIMMIPTLIGSIGLVRRKYI